MEGSDNSYWSMSALKNTIKHLRFPFSFFLLPVFLFALGFVDTPKIENLALLFILLHVLIYPSSNGFNGLQDQDTESIGGLEKPPPPPALLRPVTIIMDALGLGMAWLISPKLFVLILLYMLASRAYSYRKIRLKKYPIIGFLIVSIFQGGVIFMATFMAAEGIGLHEFFTHEKMLLGAITATILMAAGYPITQIYQHKQDREDGVLTLSMLLGIRGTIIWSMIGFGIFSGLLMWLYFPNYIIIGLYLISGGPTIIYFLKWQKRIWKDPNEADFSSTMKMNLISTLSMNTFFALVLIIAYTAIV
jgi:1,4-dihydroxy-2-naphthoate octaprenyltransferase